MPTARTGATSPMPCAVLEKKHIGLTRDQPTLFTMVFTPRVLWFLSLVGWFEAAN